MSGAPAVVLVEAGPADEPALERLLQLYQYDFSEIEPDWTGGTVDASGRYRTIAPWTHWQRPDHHAFLVRVDGDLAGFVLVKPAPDDWSDFASRVIHEFFVMRRYRRRGVGREVARRVFDRLPGRWALQQTPGNHAAQEFWRRVLAGYTDGRFEDFVQDGRPTQRFSNLH
jgi:predicted acetyltransferase